MIASGEKIRDNNLFGAGARDVSQARQVGVVSDLARIHEFLHANGQGHKAGDARNRANCSLRFLALSHHLPRTAPLLEVDPRGGV